MRIRRGLRACCLHWQCQEACQKAVVAAPLTPAKYPSHCLVFGSRGELLLLCLLRSKKELWRQQGPCAASRREGKVGLAPCLPPLWLRTWCEASGCRLPSPAYDVRVCRILLSEQIGFENHCSGVCAVYFCKDQGLLLTVPAGYRTEENPGNQSYVVITLSLPSSH